MNIQELISHRYFVFDCHRGRRGHHSCPSLVLSGALKMLEPDMDQETKSEMKNSQALVAW